MPSPRSLPSRRVHDAKRLVGYLGAAVVDPKGFLAAMRRVLARRSQAKKVLRQAQHTPDRPVLKVTQTVDRGEALLSAFAQVFAILELNQTKNFLHIGVRAADLLPLLQWIKLSYPQVKLAPFEAASCEKLLASSVIDVEMPNIEDAHPFMLRVEPYTLEEKCSWRSRNNRNQIMRSCYEGEFDTVGLKRASEILGAPLLFQRRDSHPVDVVFTWVDHNDPEWQLLYRKFFPYTAADRVKSENTGDATSATRFHNNDELKYALRSVWNNLSWINRIHIFSNCRPPSWLNVEHDQISWVYHKDIIPKEFLPTFNSHVIESYLHQLPNLTERFLYMNDDFFVMRPKRQDAFYTLAGQSISRLEGYGMVSGTVRPDDPDHLNAARNGQALLAKHLGFAATELHSHVPYALMRSTLSEIEMRFSDRIEAFRENRFRSVGDLSVPSFLYHHYALALGRALPQKTSGVLVKCNSFGWRDRLSKANQKNHDFVCINEGGIEAPPSGWHREVRIHLGRWFPESAPWEHQRS